MLAQGVETPERASVPVSKWRRDTGRARTGREGREGSSGGKEAAATGRGSGTMSMSWLQNSCRMTTILEGVL